MSRPITWQTINAPSLGDPNRSMQGVTQSIGDAFTPLREQLRAYQGNEAKNWEVGKENNTEAFMAQLTSRYKTPQELAAAQASGELDQLRSSFGAQIDQARTREALDNRGSVLQQRDLTKRTYDNLVIEDTIRPQMQEALSYIQKNDRTGFDNFLLDPKNAALKAMKQGDLMGMLKKVEFENAEEGRRVSQDGRNAATLAETLRNGEASRDNMLAGQKNADAQLGIQRQQMLNTAAHQRATAANQAARLKMEEDLAIERDLDRKDAKRTLETQGRMAAALKDNLYKDGVYNGTQAPELSKTMLDAGLFKDDAGARAEVLNRFKTNEIDINVRGADGKMVRTMVPIPVGALKQALLTAEDHWYRAGGAGVASNAAANLRTILQSHYSSTDSDGKTVVRNRAVDDYEAYQALQGLGAPPSGDTRRKPRQ